jgi:hypothetical protein
MMQNPNCKYPTERSWPSAGSFDNYCRSIAMVGIDFGEASLTRLIESEVKYACQKTNVQTSAHLVMYDLSMV